MAAERMSEAALQNGVIHMAAVLNWRVYHTRLSIGSQRGMPDLLLVRPPRVVFIELKSSRGRLTPAQEEWGALLRRCPGVEYYVWRPEHWRPDRWDGTSEIERTLR